MGQESGADVARCQCLNVIGIQSNHRMLMKTDGDRFKFFNQVLAFYLISNKENVREDIIINIIINVNFIEYGK